MTEHTNAPTCPHCGHIAVPPIPGHHDNDAGPCVENNLANWKRILASVVAPPQYSPKPQYKGAPLPKDGG